MLKQLLILSGKGGTGKTTTTASFIKFANAKAFADCDVDAPNLHIVTNLNADLTVSDYYGSKKSFIDSEKCVGCGKCASLCKFDAIEKDGSVYKINEFACEGCGVCEYVCPNGAAKLKDDVAGKLSLYKGKDEEKLFSTATLNMGRGNSGKLVSEVKTAMTKNAPETKLAIVDGSPGIGCPVIASISGVNLVLIVAEPSLSGLSDMQRIIKTASVFGTKVAVCVNKYDVSLEKTQAIEKYCEDNNIPFVGKIPFDKSASNAINSSMSVADIDCPARDALKKVFDNVMELMGLKEVAD